MIYIKSKDNDKVKYLNQLLTKKGRDMHSSFLIEGERGIKQVLKNGYTIEMLFISENCKENQSYLSFSENIGETFVIEEKLFNSISETINNQGIIAVIKKPHYILDNIFENAWSDILLLDRIQDPGNLGTIIRTAESVGYNCILITKGTVDPFSPKVSRSTVGANTSIPIIFVEDNDVVRLKNEGYKLIVTALDYDSENYKKVSYIGNKIIAMGNEANGISKFFIEKADHKIIIPIYGKSESLNVAIATGIILYESK